MLVGRVSVQHPVAIAVACYLVQEGCSLEKQNKKGKTPLDLVTDQSLQEVLKKYVTHVLYSFPSEVAAAIPTGSGERASPFLQLDILGNNSNSSALPSGSSDPEVDQKPQSTPTRPQRQSRASSHSNASTSLEPDAVDRPVPVECMVCSELADQNVKFEPCMHRIACEDCSSRMKKCLKCGQNITRRLTQGKYLESM